MINTSSTSWAATTRFPFMDLTLNTHGSLNRYFKLKQLFKSFLMSDSNKDKKLKQGMTSAKIHLNNCLALYLQLSSLKRSQKLATPQHSE